MPSEKPSSVNVGVDEPSKAYKAMKHVWDFISDILGGTFTMRARGLKYLPKHPAESDENYAIRRNASTFTPFYKISTSNMTGRVFAKEILVSGISEEEKKADGESDSDSSSVEKPKDDFEEWIENIDLMGNHLNVFCQDLFQQVMDYALAYIFVDFTKGLPTQTMDEEEKSGARPYFVALSCDQVIDLQLSPDGLSIASARIKECKTVKVGFEEKEIQRIRVLTPMYYQLYEETEGADKRKEWILIEEGPMTIGIVPLVPVYADKKRGILAMPPLIEIAHQNVKYYQCESNHDNALTVAQFPILAATGLDDDDASITIGPKKLLRASNPAAKFFYVEHGGIALEAGRNKLNDIKSDMALHGLKMLLPKVLGGVVKTATEANIDEKVSSSALELMSVKFGDAIESALKLMSMWVGRDLEPEVTIRGYFQITANDAAEFANLIGMTNAGKLSMTTLWEEAKRRGILSDTFNAEAEKEMLAMESTPEF